jgi:hypothetical protein
MSILLFVAIASVESNLDPTAWNEKENAAGIVQIRPIMVEDVNRICKLRGLEERYTLLDRWSTSKSYAMMGIYLTHYSVGMDLDVAGKARLWNGGPTGYLKPSTVEYGKRVKARYLALEAALKGIK